MWPGAPGLDPRKNVLSNMGPQVLSEKRGRREREKHKRYATAKNKAAPTPWPKFIERHLDLGIERDGRCHASLIAPGHPAMIPHDPSAAVSVAVSRGRGTGTRRARSVARKSGVRLLGPHRGRVKEPSQ
ncbi:hypothetical protein SKAU_G00005470 [Synaphobranchus kaupii]|uniref:Uncharacterized protein n=1 Tax=Synaphobranchus kaupii TaxID=118154 RepID=A0A9Q1JD07_SYNKA|nr:hypothetical protein SKAU_G00005470 [Synaphobranchus kaupii]